MVAFQQGSSDPPPAADREKSALVSECQEESGGGFEVGTALRMTA